MKDRRTTNEDQESGERFHAFVDCFTFLPLHSRALGAEKLPLSISWPASNFSTQGVMRFADLVKQRTQNRIEIEVHPGGALGFKGPDMLQVVKDGLVPFGEMLLGAVASTEPLMDLSTMPFLVADYWEAHLLGVASKPQLEKNFAKWNQKLLYWQFWPGAGLYSKKPISSLEDIRGLKIRTFNVVSTQWVKDSGGNPVSLPWGDVYMAMSTGAIDALLTSSVSGADGKFWEVMSHFTNLGFTFGYSAVTVNLNAWNRISDKDKLIVLEAAREMEDEQLKQSILSDRTSMAKLIQNGMKVSEMSPEFQKECTDVAKPIWKEWINKAGPDGQKMMDEFNTLAGK
jgi:TRAP-type transport system periplasmic protein